MLCAMSSILCQQMADLYRSRNDVIDPRVEIRLSIDGFVVAKFRIECKLNLAMSRTCRRQIALRKTTACFRSRVPLANGGIDIRLNRLEKKYPTTILTHIL